MHLAQLRSRRTRAPIRSPVGGSRKRLHLLLALTLLGAGCKGCDDTLEVFPASIQIPQDGSEAKFEAYARLRSPKGKIRNDAIRWQVTSGGPAASVDAAEGRRVLVTVNATAAANPVITVKSGKKTDRLSIHVVPPAGDQARANKTFDVPSVVAMFGNGTACPPDSTFAFVGRANLGDRRAACLTSAVVAFTSYQAPYLWPKTWRDPMNMGSPVVDEVDATSTHPTPNVQKIKVWRFDLGDLSAIVNPAPSPEAFAQSFIDDEIREAAGIFSSNWVGVSLEWDGSVTPLVANRISCIDVQDFINPGGTPNPDPSRWQSDAINIYLVQDAPGSRGEFCWNWELYPSWPKNVIRLQTRALKNTFAHELGHMFGLYVPWGPLNKHAGHVDDFKGFAVDNVMYAGVDATTTASRTRFSLGQVYRMHFDARSRLATTGNCHCDPYGSTCGRLSRDLRPIKNDHGTLDAPSRRCDVP